MGPLAEASDVTASTRKETAMRKWAILAVLAFGPVWAWAGSVDINTADAATLAKELEGVGMVRAKAIVEYREKNGQFRSVDEILNVKGIGPQVLEQNKSTLKLGVQPK
jgi:competence protein ComEA